MIEKVIFSINKLEAICIPKLRLTMLMLHESNEFLANKTKLFCFFSSIIDLASLDTVFKSNNFVFITLKICNLKYFRISLYRERNDS